MSNYLNPKDLPDSQELVEGVLQPRGAGVYEELKRRSLQSAKMDGACPLQTLECQLRYFDPMRDGSTDTSWW